MTGMLEPLLEGEIYLRRQSDMTEALIARMPAHQIQLQAMADLIERTKEQGFEITRGPEVVEFHRPESPWDVPFVAVIAVGRPRR